MNLCEGGFEEGNGSVLNPIYPIIIDIAKGLVICTDNVANGHVSAVKCALSWNALYVAVSQWFLEPETSRAYVAI